ncbi:MAG: nitroreductase family protein [Chitinispirillaceae bacterium]|nr:nitroreductase family protein [Chitinispirillaceae bacterium]
MLTTKEAIERRRSIRKYRPDPIPDEHIRELLEAARLAPSGCNAQPWRFKIVKEADVKVRLAEAAYHQDFISRAPVVIVCCADRRRYLDGSVSGARNLERMGGVEERLAAVLKKRADALKTIDPRELGPRIAVHVAIAIEHMVLRALDYGLGSCWIRLIDELKIRALFGWNDDIFVVALLAIGYPAESPAARSRRKPDDLLID